MPALSSRYCGVCRYFSNSAAQLATESGGRMPVTGCHSVIDNPESVSRVMPPMTTIAKIIAQQPSSQIATARTGAAVSALSSPGWAIAVGRDTLCKCQQMRAETRSLSDAVYNRHPGGGRNPLAVSRRLDGGVPAFAGPTTDGWARLRL